MFSLKSFSNISINSLFLFSVLYASRSNGYFSSYFANFFILARTCGVKVSRSIPEITFGVEGLSILGATELVSIVFSCFASRSMLVCSFCSEVFRDSSCSIGISASSCGCDKSLGSGVFVWRILFPLCSSLTGFFLCSSALNSFKLLATSSEKFRSLENIWCNRNAYRWY